MRYKPEQTLLYQLVEQYWPEFQSQLSETSRCLPRHVTREFEDYLAGIGLLDNAQLILWLEDTPGTLLKLRIRHDLSNGYF